MKSRDGLPLASAYTPPIPSGSTTGVFRLEILEIPDDRVTVEAVVEHRDQADDCASWSVAGSLSLPDPVCKDHYETEVSGLREFVRLRLGATRDIRVRLHEPVWRDMESAEAREEP